MRKKETHNIWLMAVSVISATLLWFFVAYKGQSEIVLDAPVEFRNIPKGLEIVRQNVRTISLNINGNERLIKNLRPMDLRVSVDLSGARQGEGTYFLSAQDVHIPRALRVLKIEPSSITISLDETLSKQVPVKASITGSPEKGFSLSKVSLSPPMVTVEGPKAEMARISFLKTETIDITGFEADNSQSARLMTNGRNLRPKVPEVNVSIKIVKTGR